MWNQDCRRNINSLSYADDTTLMAESEEELKSLLMRVKEESENADLKLNIQKTKIMASGPITSWQIDGETMETVSMSNHPILYCPLLLCLQSFPASGSFPMSQLFASGSQSIGASASASVLSMNIQD